MKHLLDGELSEETKEPDTVPVNSYTEQYLRTVMEANKVPADGNQSDEDHDWLVDEEGDVEMVSSSTPR